MQKFGRDRMETGHRADIVDRSKMTHLVISPRQLTHCERLIRLLGRVTLRAQEVKLGIDASTKENRRLVDDAGKGGLTMMILFTV
jgi:hypothetical protein